MKALSIRQPWAWAIFNAGKDVENRDWSDNGRNMRDARRLQNSDIMIHVGQGLTRDQYLGYMETAKRILHPTSLARTPAREEFQRGGFVGIVRFSGIVVDWMRPEEYGRPELRKARESAWFFGKYGLVFTNPRPTKFIEHKGVLGFFDVPDELACEVRAA
jgi:hypothetical protein